ncbi:MAG: fibronectin type III domain-containing protein [Candidatus Nanopelagicales bacterium]
MGVTPAPAAPDAPTLTAPDSKDVVNQPYFRWDKVPGATAVPTASGHRFPLSARCLKTEYTAVNRFIDTTTWPAGSYWWRVRVAAPFETDFSKAQQFTRRWLVPDADGDGTEVARPDNVTVEDVSADPGLQVARNRFVVSWEPVADASGYLIQWFAGSGDHGSCTTPHTVLTPEFGDRGGDSDALPGGSEIARLTGAGPCVLPKDESTSVYLRVRALDVTADGRTIESLWSDEARNDSDPDPARLVMDVLPPLTGSDGAQPAQLTSPEPGSAYVDTPTLTWEPVTLATSYNLVIARDRDFTTRIAEVQTTNTRWVPTGRFEEDDVDQTYFWYALPCYGDEVNAPSDDACLSSTMAVNRAGKYRTFTKHSLTLNTRDAQMKPEPWLQFSWQPFTKAVRKSNADIGRPGDSVGGIKFYEVQWKPNGGAWQSTVTDLPDWLPDSLPFGQQFQWRVRIVDESGQVRPWSDVRTDRTPQAAPNRPAALSATRTSPKRVRLDWNEPDSKFFPVASYSVFYSFDGKHWKFVNRLQRTSMKLKVGKMTKYWFMVTASSRGGESAPSQVYVPRGR